jgi:sialate O-acetylesterase
MIVPLTKMAIKGAIWYQAEADVGNPDAYECFFPAMIDDWRQRFENSQAEGAFPFGFVQLSMYNSPPDLDVNVGHMRVSQYSAFNVRPRLS